MKKTKQTMLTAALLSTALVMQGELSQLSNVPYASAEKTTPLDESPKITQPVYGPPVAKTTTAIETTEVKATTTTITEIPLPVTTLPEYNIKEIEEISVMYGPFQAIISGDANSDGKLNIADYVMLKDKLMNGESSLPTWNEDVNRNGEFDAEDFKLFQHYFLNLLPYQTDEDTASVTEPVTSETTEAITTTTMPETTPLRERMVTLYGPPEAIDQYRK